MKKLIGFTVLFCLMVLASTAQQHPMPMKDTPKHTAKDTMPMEMDTMMEQDHTMMDDDMDMGNMSHAFSLHLPMSRNGSGTGWLPDASPMYGNMYHKKTGCTCCITTFFSGTTTRIFQTKG